VGEEAEEGLRSDAKIDSFLASERRINCPKVETKKKKVLFSFIIFILLFFSLLILFFLNLVVFLYHIDVGLLGCKLL
jgi:hypothetical protein